MRAAKLRSKLAKKIEVSTFAPLIALISDILHILDIYTDMSLAKMVFDLSKDKDEEFDPETGLRNHYNICFVLIVLATMGPFII